MSIGEVLQAQVSDSDSNPKGTVQQITQAFKDPQPSRPFAVSVLTDGTNRVQVTSQWESLEERSRFVNSTEYASFRTQIEEVLGKGHSTFHVDLNEPILGSDGAATSNVTEFVQVYFASSRVTPELQRHVEAEFVKFDDIVTQEAKGNGGLTFGWVLEDQDHQDVEGGRAKCFFVARGWESMEDFQRLVQSKAYERAIPFMLGLEAPFKMVCFFLIRKSSDSADSE